MKTDHKSPFCLMAVDFNSELSCTAKMVLACENQYFFELYYEKSESIPKLCGLISKSRNCWPVWPRIIGDYNHSILDSYSFYMTLQLIIGLDSGLIIGSVCPSMKIWCTKFH